MTARPVPIINYFNRNGIWKMNTCLEQKRHKNRKQSVWNLSGTCSKASSSAFLYSSNPHAGSLSTNGENTRRAPGSFRRSQKNPEHHGKSWSPHSCLKTSKQSQLLVSGIKITQRLIKGTVRIGGRVWLMGPGILLSTRKSQGSWPQVQEHLGYAAVWKRKKKDLELT